MGGLSELFLGIEDFLVRSPELAESLDALDSSIRTLAVMAAYCPEESRALFILVLDRRADTDRIAETFRGLDIECFELDSLPEAERERFQEVELPRYWVRVEASNLYTAVAELARAATQDELEPKPATDEEWPRGTPVEKKRPRELSTRVALDDELEHLYPPVDEEEASSPGTYHHVRRRPQERAPTIDPEPETASARAPLGAAVASVALDSAPPPLEPVLRLRFLRGDRWLPARVRYISNREAKVATAAPLRLGDAAVVGISFAADELFLSGTVTSVVGIEESSRSPGFTIAFAKLGRKKKQRLVELLREARDAGVALRPPPIRRAPRLPVSWPVVVNVDGEPRRSVALDISWSGLYVDAEAEVGDELLFAIPLDVVGGAVRGRARVVRVVDAVRAAHFQTAPGIGVAITHLGPGDSDRFRAFLDRVERRSQRRVVVAAAPSRAQLLARALSAAGYAVTSSTDPSALLELGGREPRPPDIAIIDESLGERSAKSEMLMDLYRSRNVPCLTTRSGERSDSARRVVDEMLAVQG